jgi:hypothetical protein
LAGLARKKGLSYTRYADDLTFSGDAAAIYKLFDQVPRIIRHEGFELNRDKTRVMRQASRQAVTGVTVNREMGLSRQERRKLRAALHHLRTGKSDPTARERIKGKLGYLHMLNPGQAQRLLQQDLAG